MALVVKDLTVARGGMPLLVNVNFTVANGEAVVLRGPNGTGKTTLLRTLAQLQPGLSGSIDAGGEECAYAAHSDGIKATLTVAENLAFWAEVFGASAVERAIDAFDLADFSGRPAGQLSAGQRRRLGLARLALTGRAIWLLDEPTVSLDVQSVERFAAVVQRHLEAGGLAVIATHIDLGIPGRTLDVTEFRPAPEARRIHDPFDGEAFL